MRALEDRIACEITFPRLRRLPLRRRRASGSTATFTDDSQLALSTADIPTKTENAPIVGESSIHTLDDLQAPPRPNEVAFLLAKLTLEKYFRDDDGNDKPWLFPQLLDIAKRWLAECVTLKDNTFPQLLLLIEFAHDAADRIYKADRRLDRRHSGAQADPAPVRHRRLDPLRRLRHHPARLSPPAPTSATSPTSSPTPIPGSRSWPRRSKTWPRSSAT